MDRDEPIPLSADGHAALEAELTTLLEERPVIVKRVAAAREQGDLRENFAYHDARRELGMLDGRVATIQATLRRAVIVEAAAGGSDSVVLGSTVTVKDDFGETTYTVVGPAEADIAAGRISLQSPLGAALAGCKAGDTATFEAPAGERTVTVVSVG